VTSGSEEEVVEQHRPQVRWLPIAAIATRKQSRKKRTELAANSDAIKIASSACGQPLSHPASAARACLTWLGSAG
jgi:hypothetical protein